MKLRRKNEELKPVDKRKKKLRIDESLLTSGGSWKRTMTSPAVRNPVKTATIDYKVFRTWRVCRTNWLEIWRGRTIETSCTLLNEFAKAQIFKQNLFFLRCCKGDIFV